MARVVFLGLLLVCIAVAQDVFIPSILFGGFEIIWANDTSFIDEIDLHNGNIYAASEGDVKEVTMDPSFTLSYKNKFFNQAQRFIDFRAFDDINNTTWVFGPTNARGVNGDFTVNHPVQLASLNTNVTKVIPNFLLSCVTIRALVGTTVAYLAGWEISTGANFAVMSIVLKTDAGSLQNGSFATVAGTANIYTGNYSDFSRTFKPKIFRNHLLNYVVVIDPNSRTVYRIDTEDTTFSLTYNSNSFYTLPGHVAGVAYDHDNARLFVGIHERGAFASSIVVINTTTLSLITNIPLQYGASYPKALAYRSNLLYAGLNGGNYILQIDVSQTNGTTTKYATLPWYLRSIYSLTAHEGYVYFGTYEQYAKVARVKVSDFCYSSCDHNFGYCAADTNVTGSQGECHCIRNYVLNANGYSCDQNATVVQDITQNSLYKQARAGNVALGLLFAATFIAAAIGWFLLWRHKKGDSGSKRYGSVPNTEEHENFLGGDE